MFTWVDYIFISIIVIAVIFQWLVLGLMIWVVFYSPDHTTKGSNENGDTTSR